MYAPSMSELQVRSPKAVMRPREDWNRMGPPISEKWRDSLKRITNRLVLQYFPHGQVAGLSRRGFWGVYLLLPHSGFMYKQSVISLADPRNGQLVQPTWGLLAKIRWAWHKSRHEGMEAVFASIDRNIAADDAQRDEDELAELTDHIERETIPRILTSSRALGCSGRSPSSNLRGESPDWVKKICAS